MTSKIESVWGAWCPFKLAQKDCAAARIDVRAPWLAFYLVRWRGREAPADALELADSLVVARVHGLLVDPDTRSIVRRCVMHEGQEWGQLWTDPTEVRRSRRQSLGALLCFEGPTSEEPQGARRQWWRVQPLSLAVFAAPLEPGYTVDMPGGPSFHFRGYGPLVP